MAKRFVKREYFYIYKDGVAYEETDGDAILIHAKHRDTEDVTKDYPYNWWTEDGLVGNGTVADAKLTAKGDGQWYYLFDTSDLDTNNEDREDMYFVKTGNSESYLGYDDANWDIVEGYDPKKVESYVLLAKDDEEMANNEFDFSRKGGSNKIDIEQMPDGTIEESGSSYYFSDDYFSFSMDDIATAISNNSAAKAALSSLLKEDDTFRAYVRDAVLEKLEAGG